MHCCSSFHQEDLISVYRTNETKQQNDISLCKHLKDENEEEEEGELNHNKSTLVYKDVSMDVFPFYVRCFLENFLSISILLTTQQRQCEKHTVPCYLFTHVYKLRATYIFLVYFLIVSFFK